MFSKILIANRGEIAVRIIRACKEMGVSTVSVHSIADREALHVSLADESICIGGNTVTESYLNMNAILSAAICTQVDAIHPGYGLLSENSRFAELCHKCNIAFIGPSAEIIRQMGNKEHARTVMEKAKVPVIPGSQVIADITEAKKEAARIGFPLLCKARSGGGGRGIRQVDSMDAFENAFLTATTEAKAAFGDGGIYLERFLTTTKHIEVQLLCDNFGNVCCIGERECSVQRRRQKMIEESPAPTLSSKTRAAMFTAATRAAKAVSYTGVGTVEFLLDQDGNFYFMEMNTRLQVEHPVSEATTGIDLVKWQIRVAANIPLPFSQKDIHAEGHAIECRILAENPDFNFRPSCGQIKMLHVPGGPWVRFDSAIYQGYHIPPFYDSMIGKLIVHATTREEAIRKMRAALCELILSGIDHNADFLIELLEKNEFLAGTYTTNMLDNLS